MKSESSHGGGCFVSPHLPEALFELSCPCQIVDNATCKTDYMSNMPHEKQNILSKLFKDNKDYGKNTIAYKLYYI